MKTKTIIQISAAVLVLAGLLFWGYAKNGNTAASVQGITSTGDKSALIATDTFYDFGTISMKNGNVTKDFTVTNTTSKDINVKQVETSCMCTSALLVKSDGSTVGPFGMAGMGGMTSTNETIRAGEKQVLRVVYNPNAHGPAGVGAIDRFVTVTDSSGGSLQFEIKAVVTP